MGGLINKVVEVGTFGLVDDITGTEGAQKAALGAAKTQADAGQAAIEELRRSKEEATGYIDPARAQTFLQRGATSANARLARGEQRAQDFVSDAAGQAQSYYDPYSQIGQQGIDNASILTDPQTQYDWLQNNPLFQSALDNANQQTMNLAAARGRLSAGDTLGSLSNNTLLAASPLLAQQQQNVSNLLGFGAGIAGNQANIASGLGAQQANLASNLGSQQANYSNALGINLANTEQSAQQALANAALGTGSQIGNLTTDIGAALAGGQVGAANANTNFNNSLLSLGGSLLGGF